MPKLKRTSVKLRLAELDITSTEKLAADTGIPWGSLRNALAGRDPLTLARIYRLAAALAKPGEVVWSVAAEIVADESVAAEIVANNDGVPDNPPGQPKQPTGPVRRQEKEAERKGPKRNNAAAVA